MDPAVPSSIINQVDVGLARIRTDLPSQLGLNDIMVIREDEELCIPFERNGQVVPEVGETPSPPRTEVSSYGALDESLSAGEDDLDRSFHFFCNNRYGVIHDSPERERITADDLVQHQGPFPGSVDRER